jgi:hypothetical protein
VRLSSVKARKADYPIIVPSLGTYIGNAVNNQTNLTEIQSGALAGATWEGRATD